MKAINLGATLYVPATRNDVVNLAMGSDPELRSMVICLEDSVSDDNVEMAKEHFTQALATFSKTSPEIIVYARPRSIAMLLWMLAQPGIEAINGFVIPKVNTETLHQWLSALMTTDHDFMPTLECADVFDRNALISMRDLLMPYVSRVTAVRIGGNDILNLLGVRRSRTKTAYDGPLGRVIRDVAATFIPAGFSVSAPVFEHYASLDLLAEEVEQDIEHGLLTKTAIHPAQLMIIHDLYRPHQQELEEARAIMKQNAAAVFGSRGSMCEPATHRNWAGRVMERASIFGTRPENQAANSMVA